MTALASDYEPYNAVAWGGSTMMADRLARYIKDPSTIRAHCVNNYGHAPSLSAIKRMVAQHSKPPRGITVEDPKKGDGEPFDARIKTPPANLNKPNPRPWPRWYTPLMTGPFSVDRLRKSVALDFKTTADDMLSEGRSQQLIHARAVVIQILRLRKWSFPQIARAVGRTDHSTIINSVRNFDHYRRRDEIVASCFDRHLKLLGMTDAA